VSDADDSLVLRLSGANLDIVSAPSGRIEMIVVNIVTRSGEERELQGEEGHTLMEVIRGGGVYELLALCGGCCSCATCHVYVDQQFLPVLPAISADEDDLLDSISHRTPQSRLSCQIKCTLAMNGLRVRTAPEE
jgi:2Fe-2S ferredoxin